MSEPVITVNNLGKTYWLYPTMSRRLMGCFVNPLWVGGCAYKALSGLSFELYPGGAIALIGKNGAGKSTALQVLAGITPPTEGSFHINGRVCALLELGSGFNPEFTGRQNIALAGILLGLTQEQVEREVENIIDFADIGEFIDQPVKFYSSGMFVRLAFAVAVAGTPDLLIVDEALAVGDIFFRQKCYARLHEMREKGMAVILVTHSMTDVTEFCDQAILLEHGKQLYSGDSAKAVQTYFFNTSIEKGQDTAECVSSTSTAEQAIMQYDQIKLLEQGRNFSPSEQEISRKTYISNIAITNINNLSANVFAQNDTMRIHITVHFLENISIPITGYLIWNDRGILVHGKNALGYKERELVQNIKCDEIVTFCHEVDLKVSCGEYNISVGLREIPISISRLNIDYADIEKNMSALALIRNCCIFTVVNSTDNMSAARFHFHGLADLPGKYTAIKGCYDKG